MFCENAGAPTGSVYESSTESCSCPVNSIEGTHADGSYQCFSQPPEPECDGSNAQFVGHFNNQAVCDYGNQCGDGMTGGTINGQWACVPEYNCSGWFMNGQCVTGGNQPKPDTDGDGTTDDQDEDIDGDGTANSQDPDMDGDGDDNENDPTPWGNEPEKNESAMSSSGCEAKPACDGNPIQCQQLMELWRNRCENPSMDEVSDELAGQLETDLEGEGQVLLDNYETSAIEALGEDSGMEFSQEVEQGLREWLGISSQCSDWTVTTPAMGPMSVSGSFSLKCSDTKIIRDILGFAFGLFTVFMLYHTARKPVVR